MLIFSDGFESGNFDAWTSQTVSGGDVCVVQAGLGHHGVYGMRSSVNDIDADNAYTEIDALAAASTKYIRIYVRFNTLPAGGGSKGNILSLWDFNNLALPIGCVTVNDISWNAKAVGGSETAYLVAPITGRWYCVEMKVVASLIVGEVRVYIDGTERITITGVNMGTTVLDVATVGLNSHQSGGVGVSASLDADCVVVADAYIGPEFSPAPVTFVMNR